MANASLAHHAHVFPESLRPEGTIDRLLRLLDACGIEQAICFAPFARQFESGGAGPNQWLATEIRRHDRLHGFGTIDFRRDDVTDQVKAAAALGFRGLKLHPNVQEFAITSPRAMRVYEAAEQLDLLLTFHSGVHHSRIADTRVLLFDEVAWRFPNLRFSLEHVGGYHFFHEALAVLFNHTPPPWQPGRRRLFAGLASVFSTKTNRFWRLSREQILELIEQVGASQCIFGLDFPYNGEAETRLAIDAIRGLGLSEHDAEMILGGNLKRELALG